MELEAKASLDTPEFLSRALKRLPFLSSDGDGHGRGDDSDALGPYLAACQAGCEPSCRLLGQFAPGPDSPPPLHLAVLSKNEHLVCHLLRDCHYDVNQRDMYGRTALWLACNAFAHGGGKMISCLADAPGCDATIVDTISGSTPLHEVCSHCSCDDGETLRAVQQLFFIAHPPSVNQQDHHGWTALHYACQKGHAKLIQLLLSRNASLHATELTPPTSPSLSSPVPPPPSPLILAINSGRDIAVMALLQSGADPSLPGKGGLTPLMAAVRRAGVASRDREGRGADRLSPVRMVLMALGEVAGGGEKPMIVPFVNAAADNGYTALHFAAEARDGPCVALLQESGATVAIRNGLGRTPLDLVQGFNGGEWPIPGLPKEAVECVTVMKRCGACGKIGADLLCLKCGVTRYCSSVCQKKDFNAHKRVCRDPPHLAP
ncbi:unnamed protein product [Vitrella brassicaformis CCMP3155]|uniref:MYND-type domain-containing protein n=2 Tax=Vitrella brassicaformis TaxID=1169539 RepID=A0A0G4FW71_VITBC|nr:unnamed protein product [Vitrella brassicaformis CCMP3155]|eukprot:CEM19235.1 unnamed protein product [Vitrella brassicaformis CCMP3155]